MNFNKQKVIESIKKGTSLDKIAQEMGYSVGTLRNYMCANGIKVRDVKMQQLKEQVHEIS